MKLQQPPHSFNGLIIFLLLVTAPVFGSSLHRLCAPQLHDFAAVMDPLGSGALFNPALRRRKIQTLAVLKSKALPTGYSFNEQDWDHVIYYTSPLQTAREILEAGIRFRALIDGSETSTVEAAWIRDAIRSLGVPTFGATSHLALARRDKVEAAKVLGDLSPPQLASDNLHELRRYALKVGYPVIAKPNRNAGGSKGELCKNEKDLDRVFYNIDPGAGHLNDMQETDTAVVVQKPLKGKQLAFNGFRDDEGNVIFTGNWTYERKQRSGSMSVFVADRLMDPHKHRELKAIEKIVRQGLQRTETVGLFHTETINQYIIDHANRPSGGGLPLLEGLATDLNPIEIALDKFLGESILHYPSHYTLIRHAAAVFVSTKGHARASHRLWDELEKDKALGNIVDFSFTYEPGEEMPPTINSDTVVATILLTAPTAELREQRIEKIQKWQKEKLFESALR